MTTTPPRLVGADVDLWRVDLARDPADLARDRSLLVPAERRRARRYRFDLHENRFVAARAALRRILGLYLDREPSSVPLVRLPSGKPTLDAGEDDLRFNLSHSGSLALVGITRGRAIGVDLERIRTDAPTRLLATRWLAAPESRALRSLPESTRRAAFFACWTRKEAWIKASGGRVPADLKRFVVSVDPRPGSVDLVVSGDPAAGRRWSLSALAIAPGYAAAVAVEGELHERFRVWPPGDPAA